MTLQGMLQSVKGRTDIGIHVVYGTDTEAFLSYSELYDNARKKLSALQMNGVREGDYVVMQCEDSRTFLTIFWACVLGRIIPVPVEMGRTEDNLLKLEKIMMILDSPWLVIENDAKYTIADRLSVRLTESFVNRILEEETLLSDDEAEIIPATLDDTAFIQFSSGSTGDPKGVIVSHENLLTNVADMVQRAGFRESEKIVSWMPLTHDMGLIGSHFNFMYVKGSTVNIPTQLFIRNPLLWIRKLHEHKAEYTQSPNFGYKFVLSVLDNTENWDLSHVRLIFNGAEPISVAVCEEFLQVFEQFGLNPSAMYPVYGMAEATLGIAFPTPGSLMKTFSINANKMNLFNRIENTDGDHRMELVALGTVLNQTQLRIAGENDETLEDEAIGHIQIRGKNVSKGYFGIDSAFAFTDDGWLRTGDIGFIADENLFVTGRHKELIIIKGQNFYPHDIEERVCSLFDLKLGRVVAASSVEESGEKLLLFVHIRKKAEELFPIFHELTDYLALLTGDFDALVVPVTQIPKTTSGKIKRGFLVQQYKAGVFSKELEAVGNRVASEKLFEKLNKQEIKNKLVLILAESIEQLTGSPVTDLSRPIMEWGLSSKQLLLLQSRLTRYLGFKIATAELFSFPGVEDLSTHLSNRFAEKSTEQDSLLTEVAGMTDEEIIALLDNE